MMQITNGAPGAMSLIKTVIASGDEINFTAIPSGWKYLFIQGSMASNAGNSVYLQFNGDVGANYAANRIDYGGGAISSTNQGVTATPYTGVTNASFRVGNEFRICQPAYASLEKTFNAWAYHAAGGRIASATWTNATDEITSIKIKPTGGTFTGSMSLYGVLI